METYVQLSLFDVHLYSDKQVTAEGETVNIEESLSTRLE